jgi:hypothetical protein
MSLMAASPHRHTTPDAEEPFGYQVDGHSMLDVDPLLCGHGQPRQHRFQVALCFERRPLVFLVAVITSDSPTCLVLDVRTPGRSGLDLPAGMLSGDGIDGEGVSRVARRKAWTGTADFVAQLTRSSHR